MVRGISMTTEEKAKAYDEALEKAREIKEKIMSSHLSNESPKAISEYIDTIIPQLAESEDERIRRCIEVALTDVDEQRFKDFGTTLKECIVYLEKQKEPENVSASTMAPSCWEIKQKEQRPDFLIYDKDLDKAAREFYLSGGADSSVDSTGLVPIVRMAEFGATWMKERMEKEQKPADYNEYKMLIDGAREHGRIEGRKEVIDHPEEYGLTWQKPVEWSEADEEMLDAMIDIVSNSLYEPLCPREGMLAWLKNLPERFSLEPKHEWSEEDEEVMEDLYNFVISGFIQDHIHETRWKPWKTTLERNRQNRLKSLRPSWKPSEEQMKALKNSAYGTYQNGDGPVLRGLYEQLEKLM